MNAESIFTQRSFSLIHMGHDHGLTAGARHRGRLVAVLCLSLSILAIEAVAAWLTSSLALLADAGHVLGDSLGIIMALAAITVAQAGKPGSRRTFGYQRTEVIAAGLNGLMLLVISGFVGYKAVGRIVAPPRLDSGLVLIAGGLALAANLVGLMLLRTGSRENLNVRGAYLEVLGDALGSAAVLVSGLLIAAFGWYLADPLASLAIAVLIIPRALSLLRDVVEVLMESTPRHVDLDELRDHITSVDGVDDVHDLHVWTITSGMPVMSAHVVVNETVTEMGQAECVLADLRTCLSEHFDVEHSTFQIEPAGHDEVWQHLHH